MTQYLEIICAKPGKKNTVKGKGVIIKNIEKDAEKAELYSLTKDYHNIYSKKAGKHSVQAVSSILVDHVPTKRTKTTKGRSTPTRTKKPKDYTKKKEVSLTTNQIQSSKPDDIATEMVSYQKGDETDLERFDQIVNDLSFIDIMNKNKAVSFKKHLPDAVMVPFLLVAYSAKEWTKTMVKQMLHLKSLFEENYNNEWKALKKRWAKIKKQNKDIHEAEENVAIHAMLAESSEGEDTTEEAIQEKVVAMIEEIMQKLVEAGRIILSRTDLVF